MRTGVPSVRTLALPAGLALLVWLLAAALRLRVVNQAVVGSDSLGPYLKALALTPTALWAGHLPRPPNPESGDLLWLSALPILHLAGDLQQLFTLRFLAGALIAPLGLLAAWVWAAPEGLRSPGELLASRAPRPLVAGLAAGLVLAVDPGLIDSLLSGARGYGAPELLALLCLALGFAVRGSRLGAAVGAVALAFAVDHHPLAIGAALGVLAMVPTLWRTLGGRGLLPAAGVLLLLALPRLLRLLALARCGDDPLSCLAAVAQSNVHEGEPFLLHLRDALHDRFRVDLDEPTSLGLLLGLLLARPWRVSISAGPGALAIGALAIGSLAGLLLVAALNGYLQGYHLRILAAPLAVAAAVGLARPAPLALLWAALALWLGLPAAPVGPDPGAVARHDALATLLADRPGPLWVDRLWWRGQPVLEPSGVVLSAWLQGQEAARFQVGPAVPMILLSVGEACGTPLAEGRAEEAATDWAVCALSREEAVALRDRHPEAAPIQSGGAWDWVVALQPGREDSEAARW